MVLPFLYVSKDNRQPRESSGMSVCTLVFEGCMNLLSLSKKVFGKHFNPFIAFPSLF